MQVVTFLVKHIEQQAEEARKFYGKEDFKLNAPTPPDTRPVEVRATEIFHLLGHPLHITTLCTYPYISLRCVWQT